MGWHGMLTACMRMRECIEERLTHPVGSAFASALAAPLPAHGHRGRAVVSSGWKTSPFPVRVPPENCTPHAMRHTCVALVAISSLPDDAAPPILLAGQGRQARSCCYA